MQITNSYAINLSLHQDGGQPPMLLNIVLFDLTYGISGWAVIRRWMLNIRIDTVYLGQVSPASFLKTLLFVKFEPVVTSQFHIFKFHVFSSLMETKSKCF